MTNFENTPSAIIFDLDGILIDSLPDVVVAVNELQVFTPDPEDCDAHSEDFIGVGGHGAVYGYGHGDMYRDIAAYFRHGTHYPVSRQDCLATLKLLHAFYRSDEAGDRVDVDSTDQSTRLGRPDEKIAGLYRARVPEDAV